MKTVVSVVVPLYKGERYIYDIIIMLEKCQKKAAIFIELIFANDYPDEKIIVDDNTELYRIIVLNTCQNCGIHSTRVRGLEACTGEYVLFLDQDDKITENYFFSQLCKINDADMIVCNCYHENRIFYDERRPLSKVISKCKILGKYNYIVSPGQVIIRRESIPKEWTQSIMTYNGADDWFLWILMFARHKAIVVNDEVLFTHVIELGVNASLNTWKMYQSIMELTQIVEENHYLRSEDMIMLKGAVNNILKTMLDELDKHKKTNMVYEKIIERIMAKEKILGNEKYSTVKKVAIYGYNGIARQLTRILEEQNYNVDYYIDLNAKYLHADREMYPIQEHLPDVDLIIIALVMNEHQIVRQLKAHNCNNVVTISSLVL